MVDLVQYILEIVTNAWAIMSGSFIYEGTAAATKCYFNKRGFRFGLGFGIIIDNTNYVTGI